MTFKNKIWNNVFIWKISVDSTSDASAFHFTSYWIDPSLLSADRRVYHCSLCLEACQTSDVFCLSSVYCSTNAYSTVQIHMWHCLICQQMLVLKRWFVCRPFQAVLYSLRVLFINSGMLKENVFVPPDQIFFLRYYTWIIVLFNELLQLTLCLGVPVPGVANEEASHWYKRSDHQDQQTHRVSFENPGLVHLWSGARCYKTISHHHSTCHFFTAWILSRPSDYLTIISLGWSVTAFPRQVS